MAVIDCVYLLIDSSKDSIEENDTCILLSFTTMRLFYLYAVKAFRRGWDIQTYVNFIKLFVGCNNIFFALTKTSVNYLWVLKEYICHCRVDNKKLTMKIYTFPTNYG